MDEREKRESIDKMKMKMKCELYEALINREELSKLIYIGNIVITIYDGQN